MPRRWRTALAFSAGAVLALGLACAVSETVAPVYGEMGARVALFRERAPGVRAVTVGNSHSGAIDFAALGVPGVHFWDKSEDVFEAAYLARYAAERAPRLRYVLLGASYGVERMDRIAITSEDFSDTRRGIYARTRIPRYLPGDRDLWLSAQLAPVVRQDHWRGVFLRFRDAGPGYRLSPDGDAVQPDTPPLSPDSLARYAARRVERHLAVGREAVANDPTTPARAVAGLDALARRLNARGVLLVLYTPPYHHTYLRHVTPGAADGTRRALAPLLAHPNVVWMDFGSDPAFTHRDDLFRDSDHLNTAGARAFSARLRGCMAALPGPGRPVGALPDGCRRVAAPIPSRGRAAAPARPDTFTPQGGAAP